MQGPPHFFYEALVQYGMGKIRIATVFGLLSFSLTAQWINQPTPGIPRTKDGKADLKAAAPKTSDGKPDFTGLWTFKPAGGGISQLKLADIKPWAVALKKEREENLGSEAPSANCLPNSFLGVGLLKVVQTPTLIVILAEGLEYRQIFLDGRDLPKDPNPAWMGYSVGHWDGDTLVIESTGYNDRSWIDGYPHTENLRFTERWRRDDFGHLQIETTASDPAIYAKPWSGKLKGEYTADTDLIEYVCAENEKDHVHLVGKRSDDAKHAVTLAPEILAKYAGVYELRAKELTSIDVIDVHVVLKDAKLSVGITPTGGQDMIPLSEKTFTGLGGYVDFGEDEKGGYLVIRIAEGDFRCNRKRE